MVESDMLISDRSLYISISYSFRAMIKNIGSCYFKYWEEI